MSTSCHIRSIYAAALKRGGDQGQEYYKPIAIEEKPVHTAIQESMAAKGKACKDRSFAMPASKQCMY